MHIVRGDRLWNWPFSQLSDLCDLDLGLGHTANCHVSLIDLYLYTEFHSNGKNFVWTGRRMYVWTDIDTGFIRSTCRSQTKNKC